jgi:hypothetical protein
MSKSAASRVSDFPKKNAGGSAAPQNVRLGFLSGAEQYSLPLSPSARHWFRHLTTTMSFLVSADSEILFCCSLSSSLAKYYDGSTAISKQSALLHHHL